MSDDAIIEAMARAIASTGTQHGWDDEEPDMQEYYRDCATAALAAYRKAAWRPISDHDGTETDVLTWSANEGMEVGFWQPADPLARNGGRQWHTRIGDTMRPTHFQPLPPPPEDET